MSHRGHRGKQKVRSRYFLCIFFLVVGLLTVFSVSSVASSIERTVEDQRVDRAIERALAFLANAKNGFNSSNSRNAKNPAITSLAVMAFLSAGHVSGEGEYGDKIEKGVRQVLSMQQPGGLITHQGNQEMYPHGISTLMLAEVAGMTDGPLGEEIRSKLPKAIKVILRAQRTEKGPANGGWRYSVAHIGGSDISVTGWQIMALRAAKNLGCDVPAEAIEKAVAFIKRCQDRSGGFRYTPSDNITVPCTGTSILALELCGKDLHHSQEVLKAGEYLLHEDSMPHWGSPHFFYGVYYCSQATFQLGGKFRAAYAPRLQKVLLDNQQPNGSWVTNDGLGPVYSTSMAVLALTVDYRFLPIYQRGEETTEKKEN